MRFAVGKRVAALILILFVSPLVAEAQPAGRVPRVGILSLIPLSSITFPQHFPEALRDLGYVEKRNVILEWRSADGKVDRLADLAAELVRVKVDVIVALTNPDILAAKRATTVIPIVMVAAIDPVGAGLVASLSLPGGNVTGRTWNMPPGKILELLKDTVPALTRVVHLRGAGLLGYPTTVIQEMLASAQELGLMLRVVEVRQSDDMASVLESVRRWQPEALYVGPAGITAGHRDAILEFAAQHRLPAVYTVRGMVEAGGLMVYQPSTVEAARRIAYYVDRILNGVSPAELPVEQPQRFELVINLNAAKRIGLTIPPSILLRADTLIE